MSVYDYHTYPVAYRVNATSKQPYAKDYDVELRRLTTSEITALHHRPGGKGIGIYADRDGDIWDVDLVYKQSDHAAREAEEIAAHDPETARFLRTIRAELLEAGL